jgi:hypothetical protein
LGKDRCFRRKRTNRLCGNFWQIRFWHGIGRDFEVGHLESWDYRCRLSGQHGLQWRGHFDCWRNRLRCRRYRRKICNRSSRLLQALGESPEAIGTYAGAGRFRSHC